MTGAPENDSEQVDATVQLTAQVYPDGNRFVAAVDGLELQGNGSTPDDAKDSLVQTMRSWLERLDTTGKLGDVLGIEDLSEDAEVVLQFLGDSEDNQVTSQ